MTRIVKILIPALLAACLIPAAAGVSARKPERKKDAIQKTKKDSPYHKLFKNKQTVTSRGGGMTLHLVGDTLYLELPDSMLGRGMMITTTIERTADPGDGLSYQKPVAPYIVEFYRGSADTLVYMREYPPLIIVDGSEQMRHAVKHSNIGSTVAACQVKARTPGGDAAVVDITKLFLEDRKTLRPIDPKGGNTHGGWMTSRADHKKERSILTGVGGSDRCVSVLGEMAYTTSVSFLSIFEIWKDKPQSIQTRWTINVLDEPETRIRFCDRRLGLSASKVTHFSDTEQESKTEYIACRRSLLDPDGNLRPVTFHVDTNFDASTYAAIERGLLMWNDAFEKIGYPGAVRVEPMPADPSFGDRALYTSCVRRIGTSNAELYTSSWVDPRSGEILGTDIFVPFNFTAKVQKRLLTNMSAVDPEARTTRPSAAQVAEALTAEVARRAASAFGVMPNYAASSAYPTDSLRSPSFTRAHGITSSITDDMYYNVAAQPGDKERGVKLVADALGPYDYMAIEWLYAPVPGASRPQDETAGLNRLLKDKEGDPVYFYAPYDSGEYDPRVGIDDLGDDLFKGVAYQIANMKYIIANADEWLSGHDPDYGFREELLSGVVSHTIALTNQLMRHIGGVYMQPVYQGSALPACRAVDRETQRRALREVLEMSTDLMWIDSQEISRNVYNGIRPATHIQKQAMRGLIEKIGKLDLAVSKSDTPYTAYDMCRDMLDYFRQAIASREPLTVHARNLQQSLLESAAKTANVQNARTAASPESFASPTGEAFRAAYGAVAYPGPEPEPEHMAPMGLASETAAAYGYQRPRVTVEFQEHLFHGLLHDMRTMYRQGASSAPAADTRDFCRYMADRLDRILAVD